MGNWQGNIDYSCDILTNQFIAFYSMRHSKWFHFPKVKRHVSPFLWKVKHFIKESKHRKPRLTNYNKVLDIKSRRIIGQSCLSIIWDKKHNKILYSWRAKGWSMTRKATHLACEKDGWISKWSTISRSPLWWTKLSCRIQKHYSRVPCLLRIVLVFWVGNATASLCIIKNVLLLMNYF